MMPSLPATSGSLSLLHSGWKNPAYGYSCGRRKPWGCFPSLPLCWLQKPEQIPIKPFVKAAQASLFNPGIKMWHLTTAGCSNTAALKSLLSVLLDETSRSGIVWKCSVLTLGLKSSLAVLIRTLSPSFSLMRMKTQCLINLLKIHFFEALRHVHCIYPVQTGVLSPKSQCYSKSGSSPSSQCQPVGFAGTLQNQIGDTCQRTPL